MRTPVHPMLASVNAVCSFETLDYVRSLRGCAPCVVGVLTQDAGGSRPADGPIVLNGCCWPNAPVALAPLLWHMLCTQPQCTRAWRL